MNNPESLADEHLLSLIRQRDPDGWAQFVQRYQGRMMAFAQRQTRQPSDAEDLVQETFIGFLRSLDRYRGQSKLESWLFRILRHRIIDYYRARGSDREIPSCSLRHDTDPPLADAIEAAADQHGSPSTYLQNEEQQADDDRALSAALHTVVDRMKQESNLRDLMIMEGLFYAGVRNRSLAQLIDVPEGQIALVRHRILKRLRRMVVESHNETAPPSELSSASPTDTQDFQGTDLLSRIWERDRPSCPKRTTLGKSLIGILDQTWQKYVSFHVDTIGCRYCKANWDDLVQSDELDADAVRLERIFQSTIGFVRRS